MCYGKTSLSYSKLCVNLPFIDFPSRLLRVPIMVNQHLVKCLDVHPDHPS
jgi:hypothetical protein